MKTVCEINKCSGCMACLEVCPKQAIKISEEMTAYNAVIDETKCVNCDLCHIKCQSNHPAKAEKPVHWWQGWGERTRNQGALFFRWCCVCYRIGICEKGGSCMQLCF